MEEDGLEVEEEAGEEGGEADEEGGEGTPNPPAISHSGPSSGRKLRSSNCHQPPVSTPDATSHRRTRQVPRRRRSRTSSLLKSKVFFIISGNVNVLNIF